MKKQLLRAIGGLAVVVMSFYGTLLILDYVMPNQRNATRAEHIKELKAALEAYRKTFGEYPGPMDAPVANLKNSLGRYIADIPQDPTQNDPDYRYHYTSDAKTFYGLHLRLEPIPFLYGNKESFGCITGVGLESTKAFGAQPPRRCPF